MYENHPSMDLRVLKSALCFNYGIMKATDGLLAAAVKASDSQELEEYFVKHSQEEAGHFKMLTDDLARLGIYDPIEFPMAAQMAGAQYYYIFHDHPAMLLGYMAALEGGSASVELVDALEEHHKTKLVCLRHHAVHDPHHVQDLHYRIERLYPALRARVERNEQWVLKDMITRIIPKIMKVAECIDA